MDDPLVGAIRFPAGIILTVRLSLLTNRPGLARALGYADEGAGAGMTGSDEFARDDR